MKVAARFITRMQGEGDGLFIGSVFNSSKHLFKPNTIYELVECLGVISLREVGQGTGAGVDNCVSTNYDHPDVNFSWMSSVDHALEDGGKKMFLTHKENQALNLNYDTY